jgi:uncharacterized protein (TIGR02246 family)
MRTATHDEACCFSNRLQRAAAILIGALLFTSVCATAPHENSAEVRAFVARFVQSVNASNTDAFVGCFASDATAFFPSGATAARRTGVDAIRKAVQPVFAQGPRNPPAQLTDLVITIDAGMAVASFDASDGVAHSRRTLVLQKIAGEWKIIHLHASNVSEVR